MQRFEIDAVGSEIYGGILIRHRDCPNHWEAQIDTFGDAIGDGPTPSPISLAELVQRADEHTEVCR